MVASWQNNGREHPRLLHGYDCTLDLPFLGSLLLGFLGASDHLALVAVASGRPHFNGGILKGCGGDGYFTATLDMLNK